MMAQPMKTLELHYPMRQFLKACSYATLSSGVPGNILRIFSVYTSYQENRSDMWDIPRHTTRDYCITILYHSIENTVANIIYATYAQRTMNTGWNSVEYTMAITYSDWLYFLWHGIVTG